MWVLLSHLWPWLIAVQAGLIVGKLAGLRLPWVVALIPAWLLLAMFVAILGMLLVAMMQGRNPFL